MRDFFALFLLALITASTWRQGAIAYPPLIYLVIYLGALLLRLRRERERELFVNQLKSHRKELRSGGTVAVDGLLLKYNTELTTFTLQVGGLISSVTIPSRFQRFPPEHAHESFVYSLCTLCSGWWHLPAGPLDTIAILVQNLRGGARQSVAELIDGKLLNRISAQQELSRRQRARNAQPSTRAQVAGRMGSTDTFRELQRRQRIAVKEIGKSMSSQKVGRFRFHRKRGGPPQE